MVLITDLYMSQFIFCLILSLSVFLIHQLKLKQNFIMIMMCQDWLYSSLKTTYSANSRSQGYINIVATIPRVITFWHCFQGGYQNFFMEVTRIFEKQWHTYLDCLHRLREKYGIFLPKFHIVGISKVGTSGQIQHQGDFEKFLCNIPLWRTYQTYSLRTLARK